MDNRNKLVFSHSNINLICNKFELLSDQVKENIYVLMISETKVDDSFSIGKENLLIDGFTNPYRSHCDSKGGGIMLFVREEIPSNLLVIKNKPIEGFYVQLNLRNDKWLNNCSCNPHKT